MSGSLKTQCGSNRDELLYGQQPGTRHDEIPSGAHLTKIARGDFWDDGRWLASSL